MNEQPKCPKCHDTGIEIQYAHNSQAVTANARFCNCPAATAYIDYVCSQLERRFVQLAAERLQKPQTPN